MKISSLPEGDICDVSFGYNPKMYEYTTLMSDIPKLYELEEYDEQLVRRLIEKVTIFDDKLTVEFKSGVELDVET